MGQDIMIEEAYPEAAEVLRAAGWAPHNGWGVYTRGTLVFGHPRLGEYRSKDWAAIPPGHPQYDPINTPDTALEAAQWLVAKERKSGQDAAHETDSMALPKNGVTDPGLLREVRDMGADADIERAGIPVSSALQADEPDAAEELAHETDSETVPEGAADMELRRPERLAGDNAERASDNADKWSDDDGSGNALSAAAVADDAAFDEIAVEGADLLELPPPEPEDFAPDEIPPADEVAEAVAIFGDNLPMQRLLLIGRVTQIAGELKAILQEGWTVEEFRELQNHVMRISQGLAPEDEHARARFAAISEASRAMSAIDAHAERQVEWINGASRDEIASYKPEEGWP